jgi:oligoendopeptidase F
MSQAVEELPTWDLSDLYAGVDDQKLEEDMAAVLKEAEDFAAAYKGTIAVGGLQAAHLCAALDRYEALICAEYKPAAFAMLLFSTDTQDSKRGALLQKTREFGSTVATHLVFFDLEIGQIPQGRFDGIIADPALAAYRHYLEEQRRQAAHNLSEPEEKILVETANSRGSAFARLFTEIHGRTRYTLEEDGENKEFSQEEILSRLHRPERAVRRAAAASLSAGLEQTAHSGTFIYNTLLHEKEVMDHLRRYDAPESSRHLSNELTATVVDTMVKVCVENYGTVAEYYQLKRRLLGLEDLTHYDRYAPIEGTQSNISFARAKEMVLDAFGRFSPRLVEMATPFFDRGWIDAALNEGKRGGAFCAGITPDLHPYILLNYTRQPRDVMTLAHELGHGIHDVLAGDNHLLDYHPVLPMAETASTFGEMLVFDALQHSLESDQEKLALLCGKIEDTFATVFRQAAMFRFEQQAHRARRQEGELPTERFNELWQANMQEMFGDSLELGEEHARWWLYIPHIVHTPFYVYAYAFGELLVLSLYALYQQEGDAFVDRYFKLLAAGGSCAPVELIAAMGFDVADRAFWQSGFDLIRQRVEQAKTLADKTGFTLDNGAPDLA